jgi:hypothetical protein
MTAETMRLDDAVAQRSGGAVARGLAHAMPFD